MSRNKSIFGNVDYLLVFIYFLLVIFGWLNIYSASYSELHPSIFDFSVEQGKQFVWMLVSLGIALFVMLLDGKIFPVFSWVAYGGTLLLLILVLIIGQEIAGNKSWIVITSSIKLQPSEFAKYATALVLAVVISNTEFSFRSWQGWVAAFGVMGIPAILILLQDDTGSFLVFSSFVFMMFRFGLPWILFITAVLSIAIFLIGILVEVHYIIIALIFLAIVAFLFLKGYVGGFKIILAILIYCITFAAGSSWIFNNVLKPHQKTRVLVMLGVVEDIKGSGWNVHNSKLAIASGGAVGKGFLNGSLTKLNYVPKQHTDFIFSTVGEEWGFLGTSALVLTFVGLIARIVYRAERQRNRYSLIYGYAVAAVLFFHFIMNIGTTIGLAPAVGIPLPFVSYGGSSLMAFTLMLWTFIKLDAENMQSLR